MITIKYSLFGICLIIFIFLEKVKGKSLIEGRCGFRAANQKNIGDLDYDVKSISPKDAAFVMRSKAEPIDIRKCFKILLK
jgi:hypothetical protein